MATGTGDLLQTLQQGVSAINNLAEVITAVFPRVSGSSTAAPATAGTIAFTSSEATLFQLVTTSSGYTGKVPVYPQ